jgi:hypothetical protein
MSEANPATPDATEAPVSSSFEDKMAAKFGLDEPSQETQKAEPEAREATDGEPDADLELDVSADDQPQTEGEWLEIERKGEKRKLSKEEAAKYASMGFDYATNTEALKAEKAIVQQYRQALEAKGQITPQVIDARANVVAYERALAPYQNVDWSSLAQTDPIGYTQHRAQFDHLRDGYQQASAQFHHAAQAAQHVDATISEAQLAQERSRLYEIAPDLRDPQRMASEQGRMVKFLKEMGADDNSMRFVAGSADAFSIVRDAMRYRAAVNARAEQVKASPSLKPGAAPPRTTAQVQKTDTIKALHQAKDPGRKKALLDQALALKFGLK